MRAVPVARNIRRLSMAGTEFSQSVKETFNLTPLTERGDSAPSLISKRSRDESLTNGNVRRRLQRQNTVPNNVDILFRRANSQQTPVTKLTKFQNSTQSFRNIFLVLFLFIFLSILYSFIRMLKKPD